MGECCCITTVQTSEVAVIEWCGKFSRMTEAGCLCLVPCFEVVRGRQSLRQQELVCQLETKTKDNVFITVHISVQYMAKKDKLYEAFYVLSDHKEQMKAYVFDTIRAALCDLNLDQAFESKEDISRSLKVHLQDIMGEYGYEILNALVTDMAPDQRVRDAMNEINASARLKESAYQKAEGEKFLKVKRAEAEMESQYLSGVGVARQRKAIMEGLRSSIVDFSSEITQTSSKDIMDLLVLTQYFDTLQDIGSKPNTRVVYLSDDHNPVKQGVMQANASIGY